MNSLAAFCCVMFSCLRRAARINPKASYFPVFVGILRHLMSLN